eukprot:3066250-Karenia_brevis.AAC.1
MVQDQPLELALEGPKLKKFMVEQSAGAASSSGSPAGVEDADDGGDMFSGVDEMVFVSTTPVARGRGRGRGKKKGLGRGEGPAAAEIKCVEALIKELPEDEEDSDS